MRITYGLINLQTYPFTNLLFHKLILSQTYKLPSWFFCSIYTVGETPYNSLKAVEKCVTLEKPIASATSAML